VPVDCWSNKTHSLKQRAIYTEEFTKNEFVKLRVNIDGLRDHILSRLTNRNEPLTKSWLLTEINAYYEKDLKSGQKRKRETFRDYFTQYLKEAKAGKRLHQHNGKAMKYRHSTLKAYTHTLETFKAFEGSKRYSYEAINLDVYKQLVDHYTAKNYSQNTIGKHIKIIKLILRSARDEGLHNNTDIDQKGFKVLRAPVQSIYLNEQELRALFDLDLSQNLLHDKIRDVFLVGCYTAQRFSDYSRIEPDMIRTLSSGARVIELIQQKTGEKVIIPIHPKLDQILRKYEYRLPHLWEQKVNLHIKEIADKAGITEPVQLEQSKGGMIVKTTVAKNELIKTHTARRSGCTNMYLAGIPVLDIMKISGHKTDREFLKYIKIDKEEAATIMAQHPYFTQTNLRVAK